MANRIITWTEPTILNVPNIDLSYADGNIQSIKIFVRIETNDPDESIKNRFVDIDASTLSVGVRNNLNSLLSGAMTTVKNKIGGF